MSPGWHGNSRWPSAMASCPYPAPSLHKTYAYPQRKEALFSQGLPPAVTPSMLNLIMVPGKLLFGVKSRSQEQGEQPCCGPPGAGADAPDQLTSGVRVSDSSKLSELDRLVQSPCFKDETIAAPPTDRVVLMCCILNLAQGPSRSGTSWPQRHDLRAAGSTLSWSP